MVHPVGQRSSYRARRRPSSLPIPKGGPIATSIVWISGFLPAGGLSTRPTCGSWSRRLDTIVDIYWTRSPCFPFRFGESLPGLTQHRGDLPPGDLSLVADHRHICPGLEPLLSRSGQLSVSVFRLYRSLKVGKPLFEAGPLGLLVSDLGPLLSHLRR